MAFFSPFQRATPLPYETAANGFDPLSGQFADPMAGLGPIDRYKYLNKNQPATIMALASGLMQGDLAGGFANAGQEMQQAKAWDEKRQLAFAARQEELQTQNATKQWLLSKGLSEADAEAAMRNPTILSEIMKAEIYPDANGQNSLTPIYGVDPETGETAIGTYDRSGTFKRIETPGFEVSSGIKTLDTPTEVITVNSRTGEVLAREPKDVAGAERAKQKGKGEGEAYTAWQSMKTKMPGLRTTVTQLEGLANKATYTVGGQLYDEVMRQTGRLPREAAVARASYISMVDNQILPLLRDTFGAQFTVKEGETLRATLGDADKSPQEKIIVLRNFIAQKERDVEALAVQAGQEPPAASTGGGGWTVKRKGE